MIYQLYLKFNGFQVQVLMKNNKQTDWTASTVTKSDNVTISFTNSSYQYHIKLDTYNEDAVILYSGDYGASCKYYKSQK